MQQDSTIVRFEAEACLMCLQQEDHCGWSRRGGDEQEEAGSRWCRGLWTFARALAVTQQERRSHGVARSDLHLAGS